MTAPDGRIAETTAAEPSSIDPPKLPRPPRKRAPKTPQSPESTFPSADNTLVGPDGEILERSERGALPVGAGRGVQPRASRVFNRRKCVATNARPKSEAALESEDWAATKRRIQLCSQPEAQIWVGGRDRLGILPPWMKPADCGIRMCEDCAKDDIRDAMDGLEWERQAAKERPLTVATLAARPCCERKACRDQAWLDYSGLTRSWRNLMRRDEDLVDAGGHLPSIRFVQALEHHESGWPHGHALMRLLLPSTRVVEVLRKGKLVRREIACGEFLRRARRRWHQLTGSWTVFLEVLQSNPYYFSKYITEAYKIPEDIRALLSVNGTRLWSRSTGIPMPQKLDSRWIVCRHRPSVVMQRVGLEKRPSVPLF